MKLKGRVAVIIYGILGVQILSVCGIPADQESSYHRTIRSPQFGLNVRNPLSDLTQQFKPPSLSDLNDFRQKILGLANLTALLETAIAAEKAARTSLQKFVNSIKDQVTGIQTAVNPDPENYWIESKECGGILVSQTGRISYKYNEYYKNHERCLWTIRTNFRSKIRVTFNNGGLEANHDYVAVTQLATRRDHITDWVTNRISVGETRIFEGPLIFISFVSDGSVRQTGFQLDFEGMGSNINTHTVFQHFHFIELQGQFDSATLSESLTRNGMKLEQGDNLRTTIVVNPAFWNASRLTFTIPEDTLELRPDECATTNLAIMNDIMVKSHGSSVGCCARTCESNNFEAKSRIMLGILTSSDLSEGVQFQMNWSTNTNYPEIESVDKCGGILTGDMGEISYNVNTRYKNNERCLWVIQGENKGDSAEIKVQVTKEGFEYQYDYLSLSYFPPNGGHSSMKTIFLMKAGDPVLIPSTFVFAEFYTDAATFGKTTGFELKWEVKYKAGNDLPVNVEHIVEESGTMTVSCSRDDLAREIKIIAFNAHSRENGTSSPLIVESENVAASGMSLFKSEAGNYSSIEWTNSVRSESSDGILILVRKCFAKPGSEEEDVLLTWRKGNTEAVTTAGGDTTFSSSVDKCGEILHGDAGRITYKLGKEYTLNERCTWVIRAKSLSTVSVKLVSDGFESCCDGLQINRINPDGHLDLDAMFINRENRFQTLEGPILLVTFYSDHSVNGTGFAVEFQAKGASLNTDIAEVTHSYYQINTVPSADNPYGPISIETSADNLLSITTFVVRSGEELPQYAPDVTLQINNLQTKECHQDSVQMYHMPDITKFEMLRGYPENDITCTLGTLTRDVSAALSIVPTSFPFDVIKMKNVLVVVTKIKKKSDDKAFTITLE